MSQMPAPGGFRRPFDFEGWIAKHRDELRPPVANKQVYEDADMIVMVVGGGNVRTDFHDDPREEFFYQLEGDMILRIQEAEGQPADDMVIGEGEIFMLPANVRHSPQRPDPESIGLVVEAPRRPGDRDGFEWYCPSCHHRVHRVEVELGSIVDDLPPLFDAFYASVEARTCQRCGTVHPAPGDD